VKKASITETKNQLSALLARVRHGETVLIVNRGRPVARLVPAVGGAGDDPEGRLSRLERRSALRRGMKPATPELLARRPPKTRDRASAVRALLQERREGR